MNCRFRAAVLIILTAVLCLAPAARAEKKLRIVVFGAHCDDPETGAGGLVARLTQAGHEVILAYAATFRGDRKINGEPEDTVRRRESTEAAAVLGATPYFFPYDMATLTNDPKTAEEFNAWLASIHPDIVLAHWGLDTHPNHQVVGALAWQAYRHEGGWALYYFEVLTEIQSLSFRPDVYVDITPVWEIKKKAVDRLVSQDPKELWQLHDAMHHARGKECGCDRAEAYFLAEIKPGVARLPIPVITRAGNFYDQKRREESLDRGLTARLLDNGKVYLGWRRLKTDFPESTFNLYRAVGAGPGEKINTTPIDVTTDFVDTTAPADTDKSYWIEPLLYKMAQGVSAKVTVKADAPASPCQRIRLQGDYEAQKIGIGDLDGDGSYDFVIKTPGDTIDPYKVEWKPSPGTYQLEAYTHEGALLWKKDLGWSIEQGVWYSPYLVYDLDGDGKAEVAVKTGEGDPRNRKGRVKKGPEYLSILDGLTGVEITRTPWLPRYRDYNFSSRNQMGVAFLDGKTPSLIMARGTYAEMAATALQFRDHALIPQWRWNNRRENNAYWGQGAHFMHCADIDADGKDEIILGSCALDETGKGLWSTGLGHADHAYVGDIDPSHPGLEIYYGLEKGQSRNGVCLVDAQSGRILWGIHEETWHVHSQGLCSDIDRRHPGLECFSGEKDTPKAKPHRWIHNAAGQLLAREDTCAFPLSPHAVYWDADPQREIIDDSRIYKYDTGADLPGALEGRQIAWADIIGDWREEIITTLPGEVRIYTTTIPAADKRVCLMQDALYRQDVAHQSMGYAQVPMLSYTLETK